jgi:hypothetical protein
MVTEILDFTVESFVGFLKNPALHDTHCHLASIGKPVNRTWVNEFEKRTRSELDGVWDAIQSGRLELDCEREIQLPRCST